MMRFCGILLFMAVAGVLNAAGADSTSVIKRVDLFSSPTNNLGESVVKGSQAAMLYAHGNSLTRIAVSADYRDESKAFFSQLGSGEMKGVFSVDSYIKLSKKAVVWGNVEYFNGIKKDVCWNSTADFMLLYPYILADSIGGKLAVEQYLFSGGYAVKKGRFSFGVMGRYRALHEYRRVDPRPRNIVSDFNIALSVGANAGGYMVGINAGGKIYKQFQDVAFYNENGANTSELHFTGLGTHYARYDGAGNYTATRYKGREYSADLSLVPRNSDGWYAGAGYASFSVKRYLPLQNMVPLTSLCVERLYGNIAYKDLSGRIEWGIEAKGGYEWRNGAENIIDNGAGNVNEVLGSLDMYKSRVARAEIVGKALFKGEMYRIYCGAGAGFDRFKSEYAFPGRDMEVGAVTPNAEVGYIGYCKEWRYEFAVCGAYGINVNGSVNIPVEYTDARICDFLMELHDRLTDSCLRVMPMFKVMREISNKTAAFLQIRYGRFMYGCGENADSIMASVGLYF